MKYKLFNKHHLLRKKRTNIENASYKNEKYLHNIIFLIQVQSCDLIPLHINNEILI